MFCDVLLNKKNHILLISAWYPSKEDTSGIFVQMQAEALASAGYKVVVFLPEYYSIVGFFKNLKSIFSKRYSKIKKVTLIRLFIVFPFPTFLLKNPLSFQKKYILKYCLLRMRLYSFLKGKPSLIHHHGVLNNCYITEYLSKKLNISYIHTDHTPFEKSNVKFHNPFDTFQSVTNFVHNASKRFAPSKWYAQTCEKLFDASFDILHNVVSDDFYLSNVPKKNNNPFIFISIGHLGKIKNHKLLLLAFAKAFAGNFNYRLFIAGTGALQNELEQLAEQLKIKRQVQFLGYLTRQQVMEYLDKSHVLVVSSFKETFSVVVVEAFFRGIPVVATRCGGPEELITPENGLLCENDNENDLAFKLIHIYESYSSYNKKKIANDAFAKYSKKSFLRKYNEMLPVRMYQAIRP